MAPMEILSTSLCFSLPFVAISSLHPLPFISFINHDHTPASHRPPPTPSAPMSCSPITWRHSPHHLALSLLLFRIVYILGFVSFIRYPLHQHDIGGLFNTGYWPGSVVHLPYYKQRASPCSSYELNRCSALLERSLLSSSMFRAAFFVLPAMFCSCVNKILFMPYICPTHHNQ